MENREYDATIPTTWLESGQRTFSGIEVDAMHAAFGLAEEAGEIAGKFKRYLRGDENALDPDVVISELGDCQYYLSTIARFMLELMGPAGVGVDPTAYVMVRNIEKILDRKKRGVLKGTGDDR